MLHEAFLLVGNKYKSFVLSFLAEKELSSLNIVVTSVLGLRECGVLVGIQL